MSLDRLKFSVAACGTAFPNLSSYSIHAFYSLSGTVLGYTSHPSSLDIQDSVAVFRHLPIAACLGLKTKAWCGLLFLASCLWLHKNLYLILHPTRTSMRGYVRTLRRLDVIGVRLAVRLRGYVLNTLSWHLSEHYGVLHRIKRERH